jgi:hypothetical protein
VAVTLNLIPSQIPTLSDLYTSIRAFDFNVLREVRKIFQLAGINCRK